MKANLRVTSTAAIALLLAIVVGFAGTASAVTLLDPNTLTKYIDPLPIPGPMPQAAPNYYEIGAWQIQQQLHSQLPPTTVWGYGPTGATASYPGATIEARKGVPIDIHWTNHLPSTHLFWYAIDPTLDRAMTTTGIPTCAHVHGGETEPQSDGGPMTWFTANFAEKGPDWQKEVLHYANNQLPATLWYHDHAFGYTRHNVYAGLAGYYILRDPANEPQGLPSGAYEIPLVIQDRMFTSDGQLWYPNVGETPERPVWIPEFFGNVMLVNGKVWPYLNVEPRKYRFRFLNGSQARFYGLNLTERVNSTPGPAFWQIGSDGGYLPEPVLLNEPGNNSSPRLVIAPGERADVIIDFSAYPAGTEFLLKNTMKAPAPAGEAPDPKTTGQIMLFHVIPSTGPDNSVLPAQLATVTRLSNPTFKRTLTLNEVQGEEGPTAVLLNGSTFMGTVTETPTLGTTEMWEIVNMTADTHPIHLHLVQYQLLNRQKFNTKRYEMAFEQSNPVIPTSHYVPVSVDPYLKGKPVPADPNERGWKDTFRMNPGEVTRVLVRFAPQDESPAFAFDATAEPGYVWHCHILEHEENDMMHRFKVMAASAAPALAASALSNEPAPAVTMLHAAAPNPMVSGGDIHFSLRKGSHVEVNLYNVGGQLVKEIANGWFEGGEHTVAWSRTGTSGEPLANGVYLVRFRGDGLVSARKVVITR